MKQGQRRVKQMGNQEKGDRERRCRVLGRVPNFVVVASLSPSPCWEAVLYQRKFSEDFASLSTNVLRPTQTKSREDIAYAFDGCHKRREDITHS